MPSRVYEEKRLGPSRRVYGYKEGGKKHTHGRLHPVHVRRENGPSPDPAVLIGSVTCGDHTTIVFGIGQNVWLTLTRTCINARVPVSVHMVFTRPGNV